jgi:flagellar hook assembly protein FlgD
VLDNGTHFLKVYGVNQSGTLNNYPGLEKIFEVTDEVKLLDVYNYPNPFTDNTNFTFQLTQIPDELKIKIYTVAGRLIKVIETDGSQLKTNFNTIAWDGRDADGDIIANGVYLYKIIARSDDSTSEIVQKLAVVR